LLLLLAVMTGTAQAELRLQPIADDVYAIIGPLGNRSAENLGNNASFGFVVTDEGVVLIDPGGSYKGAAELHALIRSATDQPVRLVINTGGQDHRWLGNGYFHERGASIVAHDRAVADQRARVQDQLFVLGNLLGEGGLDGTEPVYADRTFSESMTLSLGGTRIELMYPGPAHTPGDTLVWLPERGILFTGDVVYVQRMLGVIGVSSSASWVEAFERVAELEPRIVVPGHGHVTDLREARADTYEYLVFLREAVATFMEAGGGIEDIGTLDQARFSYLENYETLKGRNAQRVYEELEWE
jgi:glyoxylase-like metal-dependent hydrolase (beta-lactamase superfamily II)